MSIVSKQVAVIEEQQGWDRLFREIKVTSSRYDFTFKVAKLLENRHKNRYRDVSPYDHSRVKLINGPSDYINSSLLQMDKADRQYILAQGPLPDTTGEFWQMVWEQDSKAIIMLNKTIEKGTRKCHQYWPLELNQHLSFLDEGFEVELVDEVVQQNFAVREFTLTNLSLEESRSVNHFHYTAWPDFGVPESPTAFLEFLDLVRSRNVLKPMYGPAVVHCSAGIGRSGTFALVDTCLQYLKKGIVFDIRDTLLEMRKFRMGLIQTPHQLRFSYFAIVEGEKILNLTEEDNAAKSKKDSDTDDSGSDDSDYTYEKPDAGDAQKESDKPDPDSDLSRENRKRHGDPNGPDNEKREKLEEEDTMEPVKSECPVPTGCEDVEIATNENNNVSDKLRNRHVIRNEKSIALAKKVEEIKENMKKNEKGYPWKRYAVGGVFASIVIGFAIHRWYFTE